LDPTVELALAQFYAVDQIQADVIARPAFPEAIVGIGDHGDERNAIRKFQLPEHAREDMLGQWMDADDDVRTPALKQSAHINDAARMKKLARLRPDAIDGPVIVFHPMLLVAQQPVVDA